MSDEVKKKKILMSYSAAKSWKTCGEKYYLEYIKRVEPKQRGASLAFGTAIDAALTYLLEQVKDNKKSIGLQNFKGKFHSLWGSAFDDDSQRYTSNDYDQSVFNQKDKADIEAWEQEIKCTAKTALKAERLFKAKKPVPKILRFEGEKLRLFNRLCWLALDRKADLMLDAFVTEILPKIKRVIAVQHRIEGSIGDFSRLGGYIDLVCEFEGFSKPIIFDIKTSSSFYKPDKIMFSDQLIIYLNAVGEELKTDLVGYIVLLKFMNKKIICDKCGHKKLGRFRSCNNTVENQRCQGKWISESIGHTQVMVEQISEERKKDGLTSFVNTAQLASLGIRYKDYDRCFDFGLCNFFNLCHNKEVEKYNWKKPEDKKEWE